MPLNFNSGLGLFLRNLETLVPLAPANITKSIFFVFSKDKFLSIFYFNVKQNIAG